MGYHGNPCGACLKLYAPDGDAGALYKFTLRDIYTAYGTYGIVLRGAVFEGMWGNVHGGEPSQGRNADAAHEHQERQSRHRFQRPA